MRREFRHSAQSQLIFYGIAALLVATGVFFASDGQWLAAAVAVGAGAGLTWVVRRTRHAPFLVLDANALTSPPGKLAIEWSNLKRVYLFHPPRGTGPGPSLAFEVHDEAACGPGAYKPAFLKNMMAVADLPRIYLTLPSLDASLEEVMNEIAARAPGRVGPPVYY
jgi:hypothetical protein